MRGTAAGIFICLLGTASDRALAQSPPLDPPGVAAVDESAAVGPDEDPGEIIVTALKRSQRLQDVPASVTVVEGETLSNNAIVSLDQITQIVPGIRIQSAPGGILNPVVRGLGTSSSNDSFEQTIGLFIDGVFAGHAREYASALFDIDRIEVVKGTQAAILGKNTSVGALTLTTKKPGSRFGYEASYLHDFELGSDILDAAINIPLTPDLAVRVAGQLTDEGGWIENDLSGRDEPRFKRKALRATARWSPGEVFDWTLTGQVFSADRSGQAFYAGVDTLGRLAATAALYGDAAFRAGMNDRSRSGPREGFEGSYNRIKGFRGTSTINVALGDHTATAVTGYSEYDSRSSVNAAALINNPVMRMGREHNESFGQELRLVSPGSRPLTYIVGAYYYNDDFGINDTLDVIRQIGTPVSGAVITDAEYRTESISLFGQASYNLADKVELTLGTRYDNQDKEVDFTRSTLRPGIITAVVFPGFVPTTLKRNDEFFDYSGSIRYNFTPDAMVYGSYATGSKGGGYQSTPTTIATAEFGSEGAETIELGGKFKLGRGTNVNFALFQTKVSDFQIAVNTGAAFIVRNDQIRSRGVDLDVNYQVTDALSLGGSVTYADVEKRGAIPANSVRGVPFAPEFTGVAQANYAAPLTNDLSLTANGFVEFRTRQRVIDLANAIVPTSGGYAKFNLRVGVAHEPTGIEIALVGKNLTDERVINYSYNAFALAGAAIVATDVSRTIGLQISIRR